MKIILITTHLERGGAQLVVLQIFKDLIKNGFDAILVTGKAEGSLVQEAMAIGKTIFVDELTNSLSPRALLKDAIGLWKLIKIIRSESKPGATIVHTHGSKLGILGRIAAGLAGIKNIVHTVHGFSFNKHQNPLKCGLFFCLEFLTNLITKRLIFVSQKDLLWAKKMWLGLRSRLVLIRACSNQAITIDPIGHEGFFVGTVSCLKPQKNLSELVLALGLVQKTIPNSHLLIAGSGPDKNRLVRMAKENGITNVEFLGQKQDLNEFYNSIDVFALSSLWEGLPCAVVEARQARVPVICYDTGGVSEIVENNKNGFLVAQKDWPDLAHKLLLLATDKTLRNRLSGHQDKLSDFLPETMCRLHMEMYSELTQAHRK